jgi:hypothetical protein
MASFRAGDRVRINPAHEPSRGRGSVLDTDVGTISELNEQGYLVEFPNHHSWSGQDDDVIPATSHPVGLDICSRMIMSSSMGSITTEYPLTQKRTSARKSILARI